MEMRIDVSGLETARAMPKAAGLQAFQLLRERAEALGLAYDPAGKRFTGEALQDAA